MTRTPWAEPINDLRPRPFNRATRVLPYLDNFFGEVNASFESRLLWMDLDPYQPYSCWILPSTETPEVTELIDPVAFMLSPVPCFHRGPDEVYLRNLDTAAVDISVTSTTVPIRLDASTLSPIYHADHPIYVSNDGFTSWLAVRPIDTNVVYSPITGSVVARFVSPTATVTMVTGSLLTPEFYPFFNRFDSWGMEVNLPRLSQETNVAYGRRLDSMMAVSYDPTIETVSLDVARRIGTMEMVDWGYDHVQRTYLLNLQDRGAGIANYAEWCSYATPSTLTEADGLRGQCYVFTDSDFITWSPLSVDDPGTSAALSLWVYPTALTGVQHLVQQGTKFSLYLNGESLCASLGTISLLGITTLTINKWQFLSFESAVSTVRLCANGRTCYLEDTPPWSFVFDEDAWVLGTGFVGKMDEIQLSNSIFNDPYVAYQQIIPTNGYPAVVVNPYGEVPNQTSTEEPLREEGGFWVAPHNIEAPHALREGETQLLDYVVSGNRVSVTLSTGSHQLDLNYAITWWEGNLGIVPKNLPPGRYRVYIAQGVQAFGLSEYLAAESLVNGRGLLEPRGERFLSLLGDPLLWSTRRWGETLFLYDEEPPMAPTQQCWDQDIVYGD